jgi:putative FmdB family regulatory protein
MPLYEYECTSCGERTEVIQRLSDPPLEECPECGQPVRKLISAPAFQFKGSGWYVTDYASKGSSKESGAGSSGDSGDAGSSSKKESSPAKDSPGKETKSTGGQDS